MNPPWSATLNPCGPNYEHWHHVLCSDSVPLTSSASVRANLGEKERDVEVYMLNLRALTLKQRARLVSSVAQRFNARIDQVEEEVDSRRLSDPRRGRDRTLRHEGLRVTKFGGMTACSL
jgi:hypothetical protein